MEAALLSVVLTAVQLDCWTRDNVDLIELNHTYNKRGKCIGVWWIFWEWDGWQYRVVDWRTRKKQDSLLKRNGSVRLWTYEQSGMTDEKYGTYRIIEAPQYRETWTDFDPEVRDRNVWPKRNRRKLTPIRLPARFREMLEPWR